MCSYLKYKRDYSPGTTVKDRDCSSACIRKRGRSYEGVCRAISHGHWECKCQEKDHVQSSHVRRGDSTESSKSTSS